MGSCPQARRALLVKAGATHIGDCSGLRNQCDSLAFTRAGMRVPPTTCGEALSAARENLSSFPLRSR